MSNAVIEGNRQEPIIHAVMLNNSKLLDALLAGPLLVGYIKSRFSYSMGHQGSGLGQIDTTFRQDFKDGIKTTKKNPIPMIKDELKTLQYYFDKYGEFTIVEMDMYFYFDDGTTALLPFRTWSKKPTHSMQIFGEIPSEEFFNHIKKIAKNVGIDISTKKRLRDTVLVNSTPIGYGSRHLTKSFYQQLMGKKLASMLFVLEDKQKYSGKVLQTE